jgi:hypothetical protein
MNPYSKSKSKSMSNLLININSKIYDRKISDYFVMILIIGKVLKVIIQ